MRTTDCLSKHYNEKPDNLTVFFEILDFTENQRYGQLLLLSINLIPPTGTTYQLNKGEYLTNNSANVVSSSSNVESPDANVESSDANVATSNSNVETSDCKKKLKKRCSQNELFNMIVECASEWISLEEIAREIQRNAKYLNNSIINKMVDNGLLKRQFPIPNHPAQKYKRADKQQGEQQEADNTDGVESVHVEKSPIP